MIKIFVLNRKKNVNLYKSKNKGETFFSDILEFIFNSLNGWPLINERYFNNDLNITYKSLLNLNKIGINPFFKIEVDVDPFNTTRNAIWVNQRLKILYFDI